MKKIKQDLSVEVKILSPEKAKQQGIWAPKGKSARIVGFEGFDPCGYGGTHVNSSAEIGKIIIRKIKSKKSNTKISYLVE